MWNLFRLVRPRSPVVLRRSRRQPQSRPRLERLEDRIAPSTFGVIGDFGSGNSNEQGVANLVKSWNPDFVVTVGDNNYPAGGANTIDANIGQFYQQFIYPYTGSYGSGSADQINHFFPSLGNHDWGDVSPPNGNCQPYLDYFTLPGNERYYDFVQGPVHFFAIDSDKNEPNGYTSTSVQAQWLQSALAAATEPWKIVYFHHAPYTSGTTIGDSTWMQWPLQSWGANVVLTGHEHNYERLTENGITYFVDGLGGESIANDFGTPVPGSQVRYAGDYGALKVDYSTTTLTFQFITEAGQTIDSYTLSTSATQYRMAAPASTTAGSAFSVTLTALDASGNVATNYTGTVHFTSSDSAAVLPADYTFTSGDAGVHIFSNGSTLKTVPGGGGGQSVTATDTATSSITGSSTVTVNPAAASVLVVSSYPSAATEAAAFNVSVTARDPYGNTATGYTGTIHFTSSDPSAILPANYAFVSADSGLHTFSATLKSLGSETITVTDTVTSSITGSASLSVAPAAPSNLTATVVSASQINLAWTDNSNGETGYKVERSTDGVHFTTIADLAANSTSFKDTGLKRNTKYYYRVRAYYRNPDLSLLFSDYSLVINATTKKK